MSDIKIPRGYHQPDPVLARLERMFFPQGLTLEGRARMAVRAARFERDPKYVEILRKLRPGVRVDQAFELWRMAREALYMQGIRKGLSPEEAMRQAARRLLEAKNDV